MYPGKPPDLDENFQPIHAPVTTGDYQPPDLDENGRPEQPGIMSRGWHMLADPLTTFPSRLGHAYSDYITDPNQALFGMHPTGQGGLHDYIAERLAMLRGFAGGAAEGLGDVASSFTSPLSIATFGSGIFEKAGILEGMPQLARLANITRKAAGAPMAIHGGATILDPNTSLAEKGWGLTELAGGAHPFFEGIPSAHTQLNDLIRQPVRTPEEVPTEGMTPEQIANFNQYLHGEKPTIPTPQEQPNLPFNIEEPQETQRVGNQHKALKEAHETAKQDLEWAKTKGSPEQLALAHKNHTEALDRLNRFEMENQPTPGSMAEFHPMPETTQMVEQPEEMKVPRVKEGKGGLENVAVGGADPEVLDVLGGNLYAKARAAVTTKELLQNALDEHDITGQTEPVRAVFDYDAENPRTKEDSNSVTVRDKGRGLTPAQIYTVLTDLGKSGKRAESKAKGGFGLAKAAPYLGGSYARTISVVLENGQKVKYTFEGTPGELKNQVKGVPLNREIVDPNTPTGLQTTTWFDKEAYGFSLADKTARALTQNSFNIPSDVHVVDAASSNNLNQQKAIQAFLDHTGKGQSPEVQYLGPREYKRATQPPPLRGTVSVPGADINIHYHEPAKGSEASQYSLHYMNKGLFQETTEKGYGNRVPNVPRSITADIIATVEENDPTGKYPFTANREQISDVVTKAIDKWVQENIQSGAERSRVKRLQASYDNMGYSDTTQSHYLDEGNRLTPQEIRMIHNHPDVQDAMNVVRAVHEDILDVADKLPGWEYKPSWGSSESIKPRERLKKFGILFQGPNENTGNTTLGIHIPRADDPRDSAILINVFELLNHAINDAYLPEKNGLPPATGDVTDKLATNLFATITHELAHIPGGGHETDFAYRHAQLLGELGRRQTNGSLDLLAGAFGDKQGNLNPGLQEVLDLYNESRRRAPREGDDILATGVHSERPTNRPGAKESNVAGNVGGGPKPKPSKLPRGIIDPHAKYREMPIGTRLTISPGELTPKKMANAIKLGFDYVDLTDDGKIVIQKNKESQSPKLPEPLKNDKGIFAEAINLPRTMMASEDLSAPMRQGLGLIHKGAFWKALPKMLNAFGSEQFYKSAMAGILDDPLFQKTVGADGTIQPSFAEKAGLKLTGLENMRQREESMLSEWAEKVPGVRASNRAYTLFLNKLRTDTFKQMTHDYGVFSGIDMKNNLPLAHDIAEYINAASGRGSMGKLEPAANALSSVLFSPRLIASRLQMMGRGAQALFSPEVYMMRSPSVRREYLKSLFAIAATAGTFITLGKMAGADVETDVSSSDFGKVKFGDTRIDPWGGFQQYIVAAQRLMPELDLTDYGLGKIGAQMKSTTTGQNYSLWNPGYGESTQADVALRFLRSKTNPIINFGWGLMAGRKELSGKQMNFSAVNPIGDKGENLWDNSVAQRFLPMLSQDIYDLVQDETTPPEAKALATFMATIGMGSQTYGQTP